MSGEHEQEGWFYVDHHREKQGPFSVQEFKSLADEKVILADTLIWSQGYPNWVPASALAGLVPQPNPDSTPPGPPIQKEVAPSATPQNQQPEEASKDSSQTPIPEEEFKPRKGSFMFARVLTGSIASLVAAIIVAVACFLIEITPFIGAAVFLLLFGLFFFSALVGYRKERYQLTSSTVLCHRGGLLSDQLTEVEICNITHVSMSLPWIRHKLLGIGTIAIESAGNSKPVVLRSILDPKGVYERIHQRMQRNGYQLEQRELLHEERPAILGIISDSFRLGFGTLFALFLGWSTITGFYQDIAAAGFGWIAPLGLGLLSIGVLAYLLILFLDMRRRTYRVFDDVVIYEEGFLTRREAFIPYENIADAATKRTFWDQLLNLYDVIISCQGSSTEIKFRRLQHGIQLSDCIDQLVMAANQKPSPAEQLAAKDPSSRSQIPTRNEPNLVPPGEAWIADLKMSPARVLIPLLVLLPVFPLWIVATIGAAVRMFATNYAVRPGSIRHSYRFLATNDREFAYDKITGLVVKQNLWDRMLGTFTLRFWSIGSGQSLELQHLSRSLVDLDSILSQIGIPDSSKNLHEVPTEFGVRSWFLAYIHRHIFSVFLLIAVFVGVQLTGENLIYTVAGFILFSWVIDFIYSRSFHDKQRLCFKDHHIEAEQGIINKSYYFTRYHNVKKNLATRYPGEKKGSLQIFVAGEQTDVTSLNKNQHQLSSKPCSFTLGFLPDVFTQGQLLDDILSGRVDVGHNTEIAEPLSLVTETQPGLGNSIFLLILFSVLLLPLALLLPVTLPLLIATVKKCRYPVEAGRIVTHWGLLFPKQASIILDRVDSLQQQQGPLNKVFKNGTVAIMTAGSSNPDLVMPAAKDHQTLYQAIRNLSQNASTR